jgi:hypothetical protein
VTTSSLCLALLLSYYREDQPVTGTKLEDPTNQQKHGRRQAKNGRDTQDGDQSVEATNKGCNDDMERQEKVISVITSGDVPQGCNDDMEKQEKVISVITSGDVPQGCIQNNTAAAASTRFGSQVVTHRVNKFTTSSSSSSLLTAEPSDEADR